MSSGRSGFAELLKKKPKVPPYTPLDFEAEQIAQAQANAGTLPYLEPLAREYNRFTAQETEQSLRRALPGAYDKIQENINAALRGQLPSDVEEGIRRRNAEMGISQGTSGGQMSQFNELRNLGLASLSRTDFGLQAAERWLQVARSPTFDISSGFVPIQQRMGIRLEEKRREFERKWLRNKIAAIPSGWNAVAIKVLDYVADVGTAALSAYMGGMGGGAGTGGGGGASTAGGGTGGGGGYGSPWDYIQGGGFS